MQYQRELIRYLIGTERPEDERQDMSQEEQEWLSQYRRGDIEALGKLVEHTRRPLYGFIYKMTDRKSDADEIFQETWIRAIKHIESYRHKSFMSWLFRISRNLIIDRARKMKRIVELPSNDENVDDPIENRLAAKGIGPSGLAEGRDLGDRIKVAVARLPADQREVFLMRMDGDLPFKEIATIQGTSINTSLARMQYALSKLREVLKDEYEEFVGGAA